LAIVATMMLAAVLMAQDPSATHVRTSQPKIAALLEAGCQQSATFSKLVDTLNASDVIVYVEPKLDRKSLRAYLAHFLVSRGGYRYLRINMDTHGEYKRLVPVLAHELQHAVEVAGNPDVRDARGLDRLFKRLGTKSGCGATFSCSETEAAIDVERAVDRELRPSCVS
jgi:hypothetical protein